MHSDPIADMLNRIRTAGAIGSESVDIPASKFKRALAELLVREGYLKSVEQVDVDGHPVIRVGLKYGPKRAPLINSLTRVSRPGRRAYANAKHVPVVRGGLGVAVLSTSQGLMVDREARRKNVGGEVICEVW
ncbi:MAG TPA: 30S ribosomal protein S8 [Trueperaceae bacterium]